MRAVAFDQQRFFTVIEKEPVTVEPSDVFEFLAAQRGDRSVVRLTDRVTENVKDFARIEGIAIVCVIKSRLRTRGMDEHLAVVLDAWADANDKPYIGLHWPFPAPRKRQ